MEPKKLHISNMLFLVLIISSFTTFVKSEEFDCTERPSGIYANPSDCRTFYKCSNGYTYLYNCPGDLYFNPDLLVCDWPANVPSCSEEKTTKTPENITTSTLRTTISTEFECTNLPSGVYPNPVDCKTFYKCSNGYKYLYDCPADLVFNPNLLICDWLENVPSCAENELTETPRSETTTTEEAEITTENNNEISTVEDDEKTTKREVESTTVKEVEISTESDAQTTEKSNDNFNCTGLPNGLYPNPLDCKTFYKCSNELSYLYDCPADLVFNPELLICDWPQNVPSCNNDSETTVNDSEISTEEPGANTEDDLTPSTENFSEMTTEESSKTTTEDSSEITTKNPNEDFNCTGLPNGLYPNPEDCKTFYKCSNNYTYLYECPADLVFNPEFLICDWPKNVPSCQSGETESPIEETTTFENELTTKGLTEETTEVESELTTEENSEVSTKNPNEDFNCTGLPNGLYPNPENCKTFYKCSNNYTYLYQCPADLVFNPELLICDWAENVPSCQGSSTESPIEETTEAENELTTEDNSEITTKNPNQDFNCTGLPNGLYPNPEDCKTFYKCSNNYTYLYKCPADLVFNPELLICDWAENVPSCQGGSTESPIEETTEAENELTTEDNSEITTKNPNQDFNCTGLPNGLYPNPENCETFYKCSNNYTYLYECPADLVFNPELLICDWAENVPSCQGGSTESPIEETTEFENDLTTNGPIEETTEHDFTTEEPIEGTTEHDVTTEEPIERTTENDDEKTTKDSSEESEESSEQSDSTSTVSPTVETTENSGEFSCVGKECGYYPKPDFCSQFYKCSNGSLTVSTCPDGLVFNPELLVCDWPKNVPSCNTVTETTTDKAQTTDFLPESSPAEDFSSTKKEDEETTTFEEPTTEDPSNEVDCQKLPSGIYPNPANCSTFFKCSNGFKYLYQCPPPLLFHPNLLVCVFPNNVPKCSVSNSSTTQKVTTNEPITPEPEFSCEGKPSGLYPNPKDCLTFFKCSNEYKYLYQCPGGLHFNPNLLVCDWPQNAGCQVKKIRFY